VMPFTAGDDLYSNYKILSGYSHAGFQLANAWLVFDDAGLRVRQREPRESLSVVFVARVALLGLAWSSRAFDDLVDESSRSDFLDWVERRTQLATRLRIRDNAPCRRLW
jgi:hypothetical protein